MSSKKGLRITGGICLIICTIIYTFIDLLSGVAQEYGVVWYLGCFLYFCGLLLIAIGLFASKNILIIIGGSVGLLSWIIRIIINFTTANGILVTVADIITAITFYVLVIIAGSVPKVRKPLGIIASGVEAVNFILHEVNIILSFSAYYPEGMYAGDVFVMIINFVGAAALVLGLIMFGLSAPSKISSENTIVTSTNVYNHANQNMCPNCGTVLTTNQIFCANCGMRIK